MDSFNSPWPSPPRGIDGLSNDGLQMDMVTDLQETFEPQTRARSNTWPLPRPDNFVEPTDDSGSTKCSNQQLATSGVQQVTSPGVNSQKKNSSRRNAWGNLSYADLITQAISSAVDSRLTLSQIYEWMVQNVPYFKDKGDSNSSAGWKNNITLTMSYDNPAVVITDLTDTMPTELKGSYRGSNEFILTNDDDRPTSTIKTWLTKKYQSVVRKKVLYKRLPFLNWMKTYSQQDAVGDLVAGITVGLTVIPQALAYSGIAGLDPAYGLYGSFMGCFVYVILGSCKDVPMGPSAISSLLTFQSAGGVWQRAVLLTFLTGAIEILMGLFGLGFLINFVSGPVSSGYTSAVALIILSSQVKDLLGIPGSGKTFLEMWKSIIANIHHTRISDTILGFSCIIVLLLMRLLTLRKPCPNNAPKLQFFISKVLWLVGTARNAIMVVITGAIAAICYQYDKGYFKLIGDIPPGLPPFQSPPFSIPDVRNETTGEIITKGETFTEIVSHLGSGLIVIPIMALLENIAVCKAFAKGKTIDTTQELIAIGASNMLNSFTQGYPGTGAISRGAVNNASGVRTPLGNLYTGILVLIALLFLTPMFFYIPKAALAAVIIAAVIFMVEVKVVKPMWRSKKTDLIPGLAAFVACLVFPLEIGILFGIGINIVFILYHAARPKIRIEYLATSEHATKYLMLTPDRCLIFPSVDYVRKLISKQGVKTQIPIVIDCSHIYGADFTAAKVIEILIADFKSRSQPLIFYNLKPSVGQVFDDVSDDLKVFYTHDSLEEEIDRKLLH